MYICASCAQHVPTPPPLCSRRARLPRNIVIRGGRERGTRTWPVYFIHWSRYVFWATGILETTIGNNDVGGIRVKVLRESILRRRRLRLEFLELAFGKWSGCRGKREEKLISLSVFIIIFFRNKGLMENGKLMKLSKNWLFIFREGEREEGDYRKIEDCCWNFDHNFVIFRENFDELRNLTKGKLMNLSGYFVFWD